jgi:phenylacetate-CoA ligase
MLSHAIRTVPRYQSYSRLLGELGDPNVSAFSVLGELPVVTKDEVAADRAAFLSSVLGTSKIVTTRTSGTTGTPFVTAMSDETLMRGDALWWRRNLWTGYRRGDWIVRLVGDHVVPMEQTDPDKPWRISWVDRRIYLSTWHLNPSTAEQYLDLLEVRRPGYIMGYPSSLEILSAFCAESGRALKWSPKMVWYSSEVMFDHQRDLITRVFRAPIRGLYGCAERLISAAECERGSFHLSLVDAYAEGQFGRLEATRPTAVTTLFNKVMPLVRFQLGDILEFFPDGACACGRTLPIMKPLVAREGNWIETPSGRRVSPAALTLVVKDLEGVRRAQIAQVSDGKVVVRVDADEHVVRSVSDTLSERLDRVFGGEMEVVVERRTDLKRAGTGKVMFVVREDRDPGREEQGSSGSADRAR